MNNQEAIALLRNLEDSLDSYCELNEDGKKAFHMAIESLELFGNSEQLPSAQPDLSSYSDKLWRAAYERGKAEAQHWIPCSERQPTEDGEYITTVEDGEGMFVTTTDWRQDWKEWGFLSYYGAHDEPAWRRVTNVVAWMELPEPWRAES